MRIEKRGEEVYFDGILEEGYGKPLDEGFYAYLQREEEATYVVASRGRERIALSMELYKDGLYNFSPRGGYYIASDDDPFEILRKEFGITPNQLERRKKNVLQVDSHFFYEDVGKKFMKFITDGKLGRGGEFNLPEIQEATFAIEIVRVDHLGIGQIIIWPEKCDLIVFKAQLRRLVGEGDVSYPELSSEEKEEIVNSLKV